MAEGGSGGTGMGINMGQAAFNDAMTGWQNWEDADLKVIQLQKQKEQFEEDVRRWGLQFAQQQIMANANLTLAQKQAILNEKTTASNLQTSSQNRMATDYNLRQQIEKDQNSARISRAFSKGVALGMKDTRSLSNGTVV